MDGTGTMTARRLSAVDWTTVERSLDTEGFAVLPGLLGRDEALALAALWEAGAEFRRQVVMARHGYGQGEYRYFANPLPPPVGELRRDLYPPLAAIANRWQEALGKPERFPSSLAGLQRLCRQAGQERPTPLLLDYGPGDFNCLHQDVYGEVFFPLQAAVLLSRPGDDFAGGEFVLVEQRPRRQSRPAVVTLSQGDAVVFAGRDRPRRGSRGVHRVALRHGVSQVTAGRRRTLGLIFHDAR